VIVDLAYPCALWGRVYGLRMVGTDDDEMAAAIKLFALAFYDVACITSPADMAASPRQGFHATSQG